MRHKRLSLLVGRGESNAHRLLALRGNICVFLSQSMVMKSTLKPNNQLEDAECVLRNTNCFKCDLLLM